MRTIHTDEIIKNVREMCIEANLSLADDVKEESFAQGKPRILYLEKESSGN